MVLAEANEISFPEGAIIEYTVSLIQTLQNIPQFNHGFSLQTMWSYKHSGVSGCDLCHRVFLSYPSSLYLVQADDYVHKMQRLERKMSNAK